MKSIQVMQKELAFIIDLGTTRAQQGEGVFVIPFDMVILKRTKIIKILVSTNLALQS